jgi:cytoskeletal protein CcmA (bactofilin family)
MLISPNVIVTADVKFHRLLRIEGTMEGKVIASQEVNKLVKFNYYLKGFPRLV